MLDEESTKRAEVQGELSKIISIVMILRPQEKQWKSDCNRFLQEKKQAQEALAKMQR